LQEKQGKGSKLSWLGYPLVEKHNALIAVPSLESCWEESIQRYIGGFSEHGLGYQARGRADEQDTSR